MFRRTLYAAVSTLALVVALPAFALDPVKSVDVTTDLGAIENPQAAAYWTNFADDLENAIVARVTGQIDEEKGYEVKVKLNALSLANTFAATTGFEESLIEGHVIFERADPAFFAEYDLKVSVGSAKMFLPDGTVVRTIGDTPEIYAALIEAFAQNVVEQMK
jgi:hypothetical protein